VNCKFQAVFFLEKVYFVKQKKSVAINDKEAYMSNFSGYGICGHKNSFSSGVKVGNYVEDRIGGELAKTTKSQALVAVTESRANYIDPKLMEDKCAHAPAEDAVERQTIRAGLPYNLVFEHGEPHVPSQEELDKKYTPASSEYGAAFSLEFPRQENNTLRKELEKRKSKDSREQHHNFTTTNQAVLLSKKV
jgi:hypothetical protein